MVFIIAIILAAVSSTLADQEPCLDNKCSNFTIYLGPRWGLKIIRHPNYPKISGPSEEEGEHVFNMSRIPDGTIKVDSGQTGTEEPYVPVVNLLTKHRPVPDDNSLAIDYSDTPILSHQVDFEEDTVPVNQSSILFKIGNVNKLYKNGTLNLTNMGIEGKDVKDILASLNEEVREGLQQLYLNQNSLSPMYDMETVRQFSRLTNLKVLGLSGTSLQGVDSYDLPALEVLDLSNNRLARLPGIIYNLPNLRELNLSGNDLNGFYEMFYNLDNLRILNLANNGMDQAPINMFQSLNLDKLYLNNNNFRMIYQIELDPATNQNVNIYLSGNPLVCNCFLQEDLLNRAWPRVADWEELTCTVRFDSEPCLVSAFAEECRGPMAQLKILPDRMARGWNKLHFALRRLGVRSPDDFIIYSGLLIAALLVWLAFRVRKRNLTKEKTVSAEKVSVPYTILDSKQMP